VELEIIPANSEAFGERKKVELIRDEVKLEEQAAKSKIVSINNNGLTKNLGIINLKTFYIDFNAWRMRDPNFRSSSNDVQDILKKFNQEKVEGIIIDLRGNSGGSLYEVNKLIGLFTSSGATVQVKDRSGQIRPWGDVRATQVWQKPMAVLVDRYSASASEIFAAAIQDYKRGIIIGHRTYGKGTVQKLDNLSKGQIKLTESKFYRLTGKGMQNKGILPDIVLPASWDINEIGESSLKNSLPWDEIKPIKFKEFELPKDIYKKLNFAHLNRKANDPNMLYIESLKERYDNQKNNKSLSLNLKKRENEKSERQRWALNAENDRLLKIGLEPFKSFKDLENFNNNKENEDIDIENDYLLKESLNILRDFIDIYQPLFVPEAA
jgi:carboxyl-terminal processing protease